MLGQFLVQLEPALIAAPKTLLVQDVLNGRGAHRDAFELQLIAYAITAPRRVSHAQGSDPLPYCFRGDHGVAFVNRGKGFEPLYPVRLDTPLVLVELGAEDSTSPANLGDVPEVLGQFQYPKPPSGQFLLRFYALLFLLHGAKKGPLKLLRQKA